jgi:DNA mismatch endonuclease (patch repair protein)
MTPALSAPVRSGWVADQMATGRSIRCVLAMSVTPLPYSSPMAVGCRRAVPQRPLRWTEISSRSLPAMTGAVLGTPNGATRPRPPASSPKVSSRMSRQRRRDTGPEIAVRRALFRQGLRYRLCRPVPGMPRCSIDIAFPRQRVAVFIDGCFWHRCPEHGTRPHSNSAWWSTKLDANAARDRRVNEALEAEGWAVYRAWEHDPPEEVATAVLDLVVTRSRPRTVEP